MFDVVEHLEDYRATLHELSHRTRYLLINIPLEHCLFDIIRNVLRSGEYFRHQRKVLGHIHRFNAFEAFRWLEGSFEVVQSHNWPYCEHLLKLGCNNGAVFSKSRQFELLLSRSISKFLPSLAPLVIQGSKFVLFRSTSSQDV